MPREMFPLRLANPSSLRDCQADIHTTPSKHCPGSRLGSPPLLFSANRGLSCVDLGLLIPSRRGLLEPRDLHKRNLLSDEIEKSLGLRRVCPQGDAGCPGNTETLAPAVLAGLAEAHQADGRRFGGYSDHLRKVAVEGRRLSRPSHEHHGIGDIASCITTRLTVATASLGSARVSGSRRLLKAPGDTCESDIDIFAEFWRRWLDSLGGWRLSGLRLLLLLGLASLALGPRGVFSPVLAQRREQTAGCQHEASRQDIIGAK